MSEENTNSVPENNLLHEAEQGLAGLLMCLTIGAGLSFVVWFYWALVMRFASF